MPPRTRPAAHNTTKEPSTTRLDCPIVATHPPLLMSTHMSIAAWLNSANIVRTISDSTQFSFPSRVCWRSALHTTVNWCFTSKIHQEIERVCAISLCTHTANLLCEWLSTLRVDLPKFTPHRALAAWPTNWQAMSRLDGPIRQYACVGHFKLSDCASSHRKRCAERLPNRAWCSLHWQRRQKGKRRGNAGIFPWKNDFASKCDGKLILRQFVGLWRGISDRMGLPDAPAVSLQALGTLANPFFRDSKDFLCEKSFSFCVKIFPALTNQRDDEKFVCAERK